MGRPAAVRRCGGAALLSLCMLALWMRPVAASEKKCTGLLACLLEQTQEELDKPVHGVEAMVDDVVRTGGDVGGKLVGTVEETLEDTTSTLSPRPDPEPESPRVVPPQQWLPEPRRHTAASGDRPQRPAGDVTPERVTTDRQIREFAGIPIGSSMARIGEVDYKGLALETATRYAFPLALSIIVCAFLIWQNWMDRRDPKLAGAPVDQEMLAFQ